MTYLIYLQAKQIGSKHKIAELKISAALRKESALSLAKDYKTELTKESSLYKSVNLFKLMVHKMYGYQQIVFKVSVRENRDDCY